MMAISRSFTVNGRAGHTELGVVSGNVATAAQRLVVLRPLSTCVWHGIGPRYLNDGPFGPFSFRFRSAVDHMPLRPSGQPQTAQSLPALVRTFPAKSSNESVQNLTRPDKPLQAFTEAYRIQHPAVHFPVHNSDFVRIARITRLSAEHAVQNSGSTGRCPRAG